MPPRKLPPPSPPRKRHDPTHPHPQHIPPHHPLAHPPPPPLALLTRETSAAWAACGLCALSMGHLNLAFQACTSALELDPANPVALCTISATYREDDARTKSLGGTDAGATLLADAIATYPALAHDPRVLKELAHCQYARGHFDQAHATLERVLATAEGDADAQAWLLDGRALARMRVARHVPITALRTAAARAQRDAATLRAARSELAAVLYAEGDTEAATAELNLTLALPPPSEREKNELAYTWSALAVGREAAGDVGGALQLCELVAATLGVCPGLLITEAYLLLVQPTRERCEKAVYLVEEALQRTGDHPEMKEGDFLPYYLLGYLHAFLDDAPKAYEALHVALSRAPTLAFPWLSVGALYLKLGQLRDLLAAYLKAAKLKEDIVGYATAVVTWKGLSCVYERCDKQSQDASNACQRAAQFAGMAGDTRTQTRLEQRAQAFMAAAQGKGAVPPHEPPPEPPLVLLRELVAMPGEERMRIVNYGGRY